MFDLEPSVSPYSARLLYFSAFARKNSTQEGTKFSFPFQIIYIAISLFERFSPSSQEMFHEFLLFFYLIFSKSSASSPIIQPPRSRSGSDIINCLSFSTFAAGIFINLEVHYFDQNTEYFEVFHKRLKCISY